MQLDVRRSAALSAAVGVMVTLPRDVAKTTRQYMKSVMAPEWQRGLAARATTRAQRSRIVAGATAYVTDRGVRLVTGKGPLVKQEEFGANRFLQTTYQRRNKRGGSASVTRHTQAQFKQFERLGYVAFETARNLIPRIGAMFVQTTYRTVAEKIEKDI